MKKIAIVQSCYIPWKGYFDMIAAVDEFVLFDDMQFTKRDWRNRNQIKTPQGPQWLTVPVVTKGRYHQQIRETEILGDDWAKDHWMTLAQNYRRAPFFKEVARWLEPLYIETRTQKLSLLNRRFTEAICDYLGIGTVISNSWDYSTTGSKTERLTNICAAAAATFYLSGPAARVYLEEPQFAAMGVRVAWFDYADYPAYPQLWGEFVHQLSIVDLLFNCGRDARRYMKFVRQN